MASRPAPGTMPALHPEVEAFAARVATLTQERLAAVPRRHSSCVSPALGPASIARRFRAERLPEVGAARERLAARLVEWALGLEPDAPRPFTDDDVTPPGG